MILNRCFFFFYSIEKISKKGGSSGKKNIKIPEIKYEIK